MVVKALKGITLAGAMLVSAVSWGQGGSIRSWVESYEVEQDSPFWLFVEASGATIETPQIGRGEGLVINTSNPQQTSAVIGGRRRTQTVKLSYSTIALQLGEVIIPPVKARINGRVLQTEPITLTVLPPPKGAPPRPSPARSWLSDSQVAVGRSFWIFIEAVGFDIALPKTLDIEGIVIDPLNSKQSSTFTFGTQGQGTTKRRGYSATATRSGRITIPSIEVRVSGRIVKTEAIQITAWDSTIARVPPSQGATSATELKQDDLVFIEMAVNKHEVYQGEPILLTMQLWRIKYRRIQTGPYRRGLIVNPSTAGFYVHNLEPEASEAMRGPWTYEVNETRQLLYPTRAGDLRIGQWHWEGIALVNRQNTIVNDKLYYNLDAGPIDVKVKQLPKSAPAGFSGAVGEFEVSASLGTESVMQGVPVNFTLTVRGWGNPDAIGAPELPEMAWASLDDPKATHRFFKRTGEDELQMAKYFTYTLTPLKHGVATVPSFNFVYFNPKSEVYVRAPVGPFGLKVLQTGEVPQHLVTPPGAGIIERNVDILAEDIQPLLAMSRSIDVRRPSRAALPFAIAVPVLIYLVLSLFMVRRRRFAANVGLARAHHAKTSGLKRLRGVAGADEPVDALYRALIGFVSDLFNLGEYGLTSADVTRELENLSIEPGLAERTVRILKACERARYASQELSGDEITALLSAAEACMNELKSSRKKARRS